MRLTVGKHRAIAWFEMGPDSHSTISCNAVNDLLHGFVDKHILGLQWLIKMDSVTSCVLITSVGTRGLPFP